MKRLQSYQFLFIIGICLLPESSFAQATLYRMETRAAGPGEITTITLHGRGFSTVRRVRDVKIGNQSATILSHKVESDTVLQVEIRVPLTAQPGRPKISVRVAGEGFLEWLEPRPPSTSENLPSIVNPETVTPVTLPEPSSQPLPPDRPASPSPASVVILLQGVPIKESSDIIRFDTTTAGTPVNRTFTIRNSGESPLRLERLSLSPGFRFLETFPDSVAGGDSTTLTLQMSAASGSSLRGSLQFATNDDNRGTVTLQLMGTVMPAQTPVSPSGGIHFWIIIAISVSAAGAALLVGKKIIRGTKLRIHPVKDLGIQSIPKMKQKKLTQKQFELRLQPRLDPGQTSIKNGGKLVKKQ